MTTQDVIGAQTQPLNSSSGSESDNLMFTSAQTSIRNSNSNFNDDPRLQPDAEANNAGQQIQQDLLAYQQYLENISTYLPHLQNVRQKSRFQGSFKLQCLDFQGLDVLREQTWHGNSLTEHLEASYLQQFLGNITDDQVDFRLVIVDDLSTELMNLLGITFKLSAEFFEQHLNNSGWQDGKYGDIDVQDWFPGRLEKDYVSFKWLRLVQISEKQFVSSQARKDLLHQSHSPRFKYEGDLEYELAKGRQTNKAKETLFHYAWPTTNVFRNHWDLATRDDTTMGPCAWEERISLCQRKVDNCQVDPLPVLKFRTIGTSRLFRILRMAWDLPQTVRTGNEPRTRIKTISSESLKRVRRMLNFEEAATGSSAPSTAPTSSASANSLDHQNSPMLQQNTDEEQALPEVGVSARPAQSTMASGATHRSTHSLDAPESKPENGSIRNFHSSKKPPKKRLRYFQRLFRNFGVKDQSEQLSSSSSSTPSLHLSQGIGLDNLMATPPMALPIYTNLRPRALVDYSTLMSPCNDGRVSTAVQRISESLENPSSTAVDFLSWLDSKSMLSSSLSNPMDVMFDLICEDIRTTCQMLMRVLTEISRDIPDELLLQRRLAYWRNWLDRFDKEIQNLEETMTNISKYLLSLSTGDLYQRIPRYEATLELIRDSRNRKDQVHATLMANLSIVQSKRSVTQAESVARVTELAFIFIPISFAASVFGMQVKELNPEQTSISAFFALTIIIVGLLYFLRLMIRSESFFQLKRYFSTEVRKYGGLRDDADVPALTVLGYLLRNAVQLVLGGLLKLNRAVVSMLIFALVLLLPLWESSLAIGIKTCITIAIIFMFAVPGLGLVLLWFQTGFQGVQRRHRAEELEKWF